MSDIIEIYSNLYKHQKDCIDSKKRLSKSLINIWCGGGKTRIIVYSIFDDDKEVNVIVFPSLGLINQFNNDYILSEDFMDYFKEYHCLSVCSDSDKKLNPPEKIDKSRFPNIKYTTDKRQITSTLKKDGKKLFTVTYQSLEMFMNIIIEKNITINRLYYDEAHHILGHNIQNIVFKNDKLNELIEKTEFYTATPDNKNGITMYDKDNPENSDCGPIAYEYLFYQAVKDEVSKDFTMKLMLYPKTKEDMYINLFKSIFRECFTGDYDYWNILTFHSMVEEKDDMATVNQLSKKEKLFKKCFLEVIEEFPDKKSLYSVENVFLKGIGSKTKKRESIIKDFDKPEKGRIYLIASCKTLGEGIDTKYANMEIPINPGGSVVYEQQKLGRITRNPGGNNPNGIVLIPCWIDMEKYEGLDKYQRDEMIRQELHEGGNFNTFLNVMSAYKNQCDPELWELCLKYPKMYSPKEIKDNLDKQGFKVDESKGDLIQNVNHIVGEDISDLEGETDEETIQNIVSTGKQVEIHSQDKDLPIITYGSSSGSDEEPIRLFKDENDVYHPVSKKEPAEPKRKIEKPDKLKRKKLVNVHMNDEIKVLWKIDESSFDSIDGAFCHGVLDAEIEYDEKRFERWYENLEKVKKYIDENKERPNKRSKNNEIQILGRWVSQQKNNYQKKIQIMKELDIRKVWENFINDYSKYYKNNYEKWYDNLNKIEEYIKNVNKIPTSYGNTENINDLGRWLTTQKLNYQRKLFIMKNEEIRESWEIFIDKYKKYFNEDNNILWYKKLNELEEYIIKNKKLPSTIDDNKDIQKLSGWCGNQIRNHKKGIQIMKETEIKNAWEEFTKKYSEYFKTIVDLWFEKINMVEDYIKKNKKLPSSIDNNEEIKALGNWLSSQKTNYKSKSIRKAINDPLARGKWEDFTEKYSEYFKDNWLSCYELLKEYMKNNDNKCPKYSYTENDIKLGQWMGTQRYNYKLNKLQQKYIELLEDIPGWMWDNGHEEIIKNNIEYIIDFVNNNNRLPGRTNENEKYYSNWLNKMKQEYKNENLEGNDKLMYEEFINNSCIKEYIVFIEEDTHIKEFMKNLDQLEKFIIENKRLPSRIIDSEKKTAAWIDTRNKTYCHKTKLMKNEDTRKIWEDFVNKYIEYFEGKSPKEKWIYNYNKLISWFEINRRRPRSIQGNIKDINENEKEEVYIGMWLLKQNRNYKNNKYPFNEDKEIKLKWENFKNNPEYEDLLTVEEIWYLNLKKSTEYFEINNTFIPIINDIKLKKLRTWLMNNKNSYNNKRMPKIYIEHWKGFFDKYSSYFPKSGGDRSKTKKDMSKKEIKPMVKKETTEQKRERTKSEISILHQKYKTMNSQTLHKHFEDNPEDWENYHKISEENEETFPDEEIPYKKIIEYLDKIPGKKAKDVVDLGCGKARVCEHFSDSERFKFINMDHVSCNDLVQKQDIKDTGLDDYSMDIVVLSLAMWGSNCKEYITESNRILDENGVLLIIEATKRWTDDETGENKLVKLLEKNNFTIKNINEEKFMFIECIKK